MYNLKLTADEVNKVVEILNVTIKSVGLHNANLTRFCLVILQRLNENMAEENKKAEEKKDKQKAKK